jgi:hypothetical protein
VAEEVADRAGVGARVEHVHGGRVPEDVRVDPLRRQSRRGRGGGTRVPLQQVADAPARKGPAAEV